MSPEPPKYVKGTVRSELPERLSEPVLDADWFGPPFGVLGIDSQERVVMYGGDGVLVRHPVAGGELADRSHSGYESGFKGFDPHTGGGAVQSLDTTDWMWIHPRYRWMTDHTPGLKLTH